MIELIVFFIETRIAMSLDKSGFTSKLKGSSLVIEVEEKHPLINLGNVLDWNSLYSIVEQDLKKRNSLKEKIKWWLGRKWFLRIHLAVFFLQSLKPFTDRQMEEALGYNAAYQIFCGRGVVSQWPCPDHTKIADFRNRLSPDTQHQLVSEVLKIGKAQGFVDPSQMDIDSTVQEAHIAYPTDARLLSKLAEKGAKGAEALKHQGQEVFSHIRIDLKAIKAKAKTYFFLAKNKKIEETRKVFQELYQAVQSQMSLLLEKLQKAPSVGEGLKWNIKQSLEPLKSEAIAYLQAVAYFVETHTMKEGKLLAFHAQAITCIGKGKVGKENECGRVFQLARLGGNFMMVMKSTSLREADKQSVKPFVQEHQETFGKGKLDSVGADQAYFTKKNVLYLRELVDQVHLQQPINIKKDWSGLDEETKEKLSNRRAGVEALIGHLKNKWGLRRSQMKSDQTTLASGYRSVLGFNLHQLTRHQQGVYQNTAASGGSVNLPILLIFFLERLSDVHRVGIQMIFQRSHDTQIRMIALRQVYFILRNRLVNSLIIHDNFCFDAQLGQIGIKKTIHQTDRKENPMKLPIEKLKTTEQKVSEGILRKFKI